MTGSLQERVAVSCMGKDCSASAVMGTLEMPGQLMLARGRGSVGATELASLEKAGAAETASSAAARRT